MAQAIMRAILDKLLLQPKLTPGLESKLTALLKCVAATLRHTHVRLESAGRSPAASLMPWLPRLPRRPSGNASARQRTMVSLAVMHLTV